MDHGQSMQRADADPGNLGKRPIREHVIRKVAEMTLDPSIFIYLPLHAAVCYPLHRRQGHVMLMRGSRALPYRLLGDPGGE